MIGRVLPRGSNVRGVLHYLYGKGRRNEHVDPHLVAGWLPPRELEPQRRPDGGRDFSVLTGLLELPVLLARGKVADKHVYHVAVRGAPEDADLDDGAWAAIAAEIMDRTGLSARGREDQGVRWVAVRHGGNHIHIVATLAGQDRRPAWPRNDYYRIGEVLRDAERSYGLQTLAHDRTAAKSPTRAELEQSARSGREPDRVILYRAVRVAAAAARTEEEFLAGLQTRGLRVRLRPSATCPSEAAGYAVARDSETGRREVWFSGGKLAADLTLPKLRRRWTGPPLSGRGMGDPAARAVLASEALWAARSARSQPEFLALLGRAGLPARLQAAPGRPPAFLVTLPGLADQAGRPAWHPGGRLDQALDLGRLRARWAAGRPGAPLGPDHLGGAARAAVYEHASRAASRAAAELKAGRADIALATADLLTAASEATGNAELGRAAEHLARAARPAWARAPAPSPNAAMLRTAAYLIASSGRTRHPQAAHSFRLLLTTLAALARTLAELRAAQDRPLQSAAAALAAARLAAAATEIDHTETASQLAATAFPTRPGGSRPGWAAAAGSLRSARRPPPAKSPGRPRPGI